MYKVSPEFYVALAEKLLEQIDLKEYYSGVFEFEFEDVSCRMVLSAVIYRSLTTYPEEPSRIVRDVVPIWWELHTYNEGEECLNDFSFSELREYLKEW